MLQLHNQTWIGFIVFSATQLSSNSEHTFCRLFYLLHALLRQMQAQLSCGCFIFIFTIKRMKDLEHFQWTAGGWVEGGGRAHRCSGIMLDEEEGLASGTWTWLWRRMHGVAGATSSGRTTRHLASQRGMAQTPWQLSSSAADEPCCSWWGDQPCCVFYLMVSNHAVHDVEMNTVGHGS